MRWVGIDEAGYGPNLGPLVMTAVVAEGSDDRPPDVWGDLAGSVSRAGDSSARLWVDDSKQVYKAGKGRDRLDASTLATLAATGRAVPESFGGLVEALGSGSLDEIELSGWLDSGDPRYPGLRSRSMADRARARRPFEGAPWRLVDVRAVVVGPRRFNAGLEATGSKALVHFDAFARLLGYLWQSTPEGQDLSIRSDKHGGRHFYGDLLATTFPEARVDRGPEGPSLSHYRVVAPARRLALSLVPRADADDGLVALASIVSKAVREGWMDAFNAHWLARVPGLRPTAGYPVDAARFRLAIEPLCRARGLATEDWWRSR